MSNFRRTLPEIGLAYLETRPAWWQDLLDYRFIDTGDCEQPLFLAIRNGYLNAYVEGQSVLKVGFSSRNSLTPFRGTVHHKYVVKNAAEQRYLKFNGHKIDGHTYAEKSSLNEWANEAKTYSTPEKRGVAAIAGRNTHVIDVEMGLPFNKVVGIDTRPNAPRMDIVALEANGDAIKIVFYEAKLFRNPELRANNLNPPVLTQLQRYEDWINTDNRADEVVEAYHHTCRILVRLNATRRDVRRQRVHSLVERAGSDRSVLCVDRKPRLIIFGYDPEHRNAAWDIHQGALRRAGIDGDRLIMAPHAKDVALAETARSSA